MNKKIKQINKRLNTLSQKSNTVKRSVGRGRKRGRRNNGRTPGTRGTSWFNTNKHSITLSHTELVTSVTTDGSGAFSYSYFEINPGITKTFPWLSGIAACYERYVFTKLMFHYKPVCATTSSGSIVLAVDYDAADIDNETYTRSQVMTFEGACVTPVWKPVTMNCNKSSLNQVDKHYTRYGTLRANGDIKMYDSGNLIIGSLSDDVITAGDIFVSYTIRFETPQLSGEQDEYVSFTDSATVNAGGTLWNDPANMKAGGAAIQRYSDQAIKFLKEGKYAFSQMAADDGTAFSTHGTPVLTTPGASTGSIETFSSGSSADSCSTGELDITNVDKSTPPYLTIPGPTSAGTIAEVITRIVPTSVYEEFVLSFSKEENEMVNRYLKKELKLEPKDTLFMNMKKRIRYNFSKIKKYLRSKGRDFTKYRIPPSMTLKHFILENESEE